MSVARELSKLSTAGGGVRDGLWMLRNPYSAFAICFEDTSAVQSEEETIARRKSSANTETISNTTGTLADKP